MTSYSAEWHDEQEEVTQVRPRGAHAEGRIYRVKREDGRIVYKRSLFPWNLANDWRVVEVDLVPETPFNIASVAFDLAHAEPVDEFERFDTIVRMMAGE